MLYRQLAVSRVVRQRNRSSTSAPCIRFYSPIAVIPLGRNCFSGCTFRPRPAMETFR